MHVIIRKNKRQVVRSRFVQSHFLDNLTNHGVCVKFISGESISGVLVGFDDYCLLIETEKGHVLVYKHAIQSLSGLKNE